MVTEIVKRILDSQFQYHIITFLNDFVAWHTLSNLALALKSSRSIAMAGIYVPADNLLVQKVDENII